jgi:hypothetical protein
MWWNGTTWQSGRTTVDTVLGTGTTTRGRSYDFDPPTPATQPYWVTVRSFDAAANPSGYSYRNFTISTTDSVAPTVTVTTPLNWATVSGPVSVGGSSGDNVGVTSVVLEIFDRDSTMWWNGTTWQTGRTSVTAVVVGTDWSFVFDAPGPWPIEPYWVTVRSFDVSGNASDYAYVNFTVE